MSCECKLIMKLMGFHKTYTVSVLCGTRESEEDFVSESAFVRNCDARVHSLDTYTEPSLLAAVTDAGELRWCKHEEGLMILIPHGWITSSVADLRPEVVPPLPPRVTARA